MSQKSLSAKQILSSVPRPGSVEAAAINPPTAGKNFISRAIIDYFYYDRFNVITDLIKRSDKPGANAMDIGCDIGDLAILISDLGYDIIGLDHNVSALKRLAALKYQVVMASVPPLPFLGSAFDLITAIGLTEHVSDEKLLVKEVHRVLKPNGIYICAMPIEIGIAGFIRYIAKNIAYPHRGDSKLIFNYSLDEFKGNCSREMHRQDHKYYNYKYLLSDLNNIFNSVAIHTWPRTYPKSIAPILIAKCIK